MSYTARPEKTDTGFMRQNYADGIRHAIDRLQIAYFKQIAHLLKFHMIPAELFVKASHGCT